MTVKKAIPVTPKPVKPKRFEVGYKFKVEFEITEVFHEDDQFRVKMPIGAEYLDSENTQIVWDTYHFDRSELEFVENSFTIKGKKETLNKQIKEEEDKLKSSQDKIADLKTKLSQVK